MLFFAVAGHCHVIARRVGNTLGGPATNQRLDFRGMTIARVRDGRMVEAWNCFDFLKI
jgi:hypothetical protein